MNKLLIFLLIFTVQFAQGAAVIFNGNEVKALKPNLNLFDEAKILTGSVDPSSVATSAPTGSLYLNTTTGSVYRKTDDGLTTNWTEMVSGLTGPVSSTDTSIALFDGTGGDTLKDSGVLIDASDNITGVGDLSISGTATIGTLSGVLKGSSGVLSASSIVNADVDAAAAISFSKMEALTADRVLVTDPSGLVSASSVTTTTLGFLDATSSIQGQLNAVDTLIDDHIADASGAHAASAISNTPSGNLAATDVQGALNELQSDVDTRALDSDLSTHISDTTTHGTTGDIVGTTDTQTLTSKLVDGDDNTIQDLAVSVFKTVIGNANTVLTFDGSGAPAAIKVTPTYISSGAASNYEFLQADGFGNTNFEPIIAAAIDSEASTDGYVLTSDGAGGAAWEAPTATTGPPLVTVYNSGSGTHTFTGTPLYITVEMVGGGGGGGAGGTSGGTAATAGTNSTFASTLVVAGGGAAGANDGEGAAGGNSSFGAGATGIIVQGGRGGGSMRQGTSPLSQLVGGHGGSSAFGGAGSGGIPGGSGNGQAAYANSGSGGGGGYCSATTNCNTGAGGGSGGYAKAWISGATLSGLSGSAAYSVGVGGNGQVAGTGGGAGGGAASGKIVVTEYY